MGGILTEDGLFILTEASEYILTEVPPTLPTFVADYEGAPAWPSTTTPKVTPSFNGLTGDVLVSLLSDANQQAADVDTWSSNPSETWTETAGSTGGTSADSRTKAAYATLSANRTGMTVSLAAQVGGDFFNHVVAHFRNSAGIGNTASSPRVSNTGGPSFAFTTAYDNSAIAFVMAEWNVVDASGRAYRTVNGQTPTEIQFHTSVNLNTLTAIYLDAGVAGVKTIGLTAPTTGRWVVTAVEVRGP